MQSKSLPSRYKTLSISCRCGQQLCDYAKGGSGTLIKVNPYRILRSYCDVFDGTPAADTNVHCPSCAKRVALVKNIAGVFMFKINRGQVVYC